MMTREESALVLQWIVKTAAAADEQKMRDQIVREQEEKALRDKPDSPAAAKTVKNVKDSLGSMGAKFSQGAAGIADNMRAAHDKEQAGPNAIKAIGNKVSGAVSAGTLGAINGVKGLFRGKDETAADQAKDDALRSKVQNDMSSETAAKGVTAVKDMRGVLGKIGTQISNKVTADRGTKAVSDLRDSAESWGAGGQMLKAGFSNMMDDRAAQKARAAGVVNKGTKAVSDLRDSAESWGAGGQMLKAGFSNMMDDRAAQKISAGKAALGKAPGLMQAVGAAGKTAFNNLAGAGREILAGNRATVGRSAPGRRNPTTTGTAPAQRSPAGQRPTPSVSTPATVPTQTTTMGTGTAGLGASQPALARRSSTVPGMPTGRRSTPAAAAISTTSPTGPAATQPRTVSSASSVLGSMPSPTFGSTRGNIPTSQRMPGVAPTQDAGNGPGKRALRTVLSSRAPRERPSIL